MCYTQVCRKLPDVYTVKSASVSCAGRSTHVAPFCDLRMWLELVGGADDCVYCITDCV